MNSGAPRRHVGDRRSFMVITKVVRILISRGRRCDIHNYLKLREAIHPGHRWAFDDIPQHEIDVVLQSKSIAGSLSVLPLYAVHHKP
jgi:hypothetical protein